MRECRKKIVQTRKPSSFLVAALCLMGGIACDSPNSEQIEKVRSLHAEGRYEEIIEPITELIGANPDDPELLHIFGQSLLENGDSASAVWPLRKAAESPGREVTDGLLLAQALMRGGNQEETVRALNRVLEYEPDHVDVLVLRGTLLLELARSDEALEDLDRAIELEPARLGARLKRVEIWVEQEKLDQAEEELKLARARAEGAGSGKADIPRICVAKVAMAEKRGSLDQAGSQIEQCLSEFPADPILIREGLRIFDELEDSNRALQVLRRAVEKRPARLLLRKQLAQRLSQAGQTDEAEQLLREWAQRPDGPSEAWSLLANHYRSVEDYPKAIAAIEVVLDRQDSFEPLFLAEYADDLIQAEQYAKAEEVIELLAGEPQLSHLLKGRVYLSRGNPAAALEELDAGFELWPGNVTARWMAAQASEQLGDFDRAMENYRAAIRGDVVATDAAIRLARIYQAEGNHEAALVTLGMLVRATPEDPEPHLVALQIAAKAKMGAAIERMIEALSNLPGQEAVAALAGGRATASLRGPAAAIKEIERHGLDLSQTKNADVLGLWAVQLASLGREEEGLEEIEAAMAAHPDSAGLHEAHGMTLKAAGRDPETFRPAFARAIALDPERSVALGELAELERAEGNDAAALAFYDRAAAANPDAPEHALAATLLADDAEQAERLERLTSNHPLFAPGLLRFAQRALALEDLERADHLIRQSIRFGGGAPALDTQGRIALARGNAPAALKAFRAALALDPGSPSTRYHFAVALERIGDISAAQHAFEQALERGDFPEAEATRKKLANWQEAGVN